VASLQRGTRHERAAINGAANRAARRRRSRPPAQTTWAWQARQGDGSTLQTELADARERIWELNEELASTIEELHEETTQVHCLRGFVLQKASELNERKKEEQISNSRDRKNLEEEWKKNWKKGNGNTIWN